MTRDDLLQTVTRGNELAFAFLDDLLKAIHVWDDLIDRDMPVSSDEINRAFTFAFIGLPSNAFYAQNFQHLYPIMCGAVTDWLAANELERNPQSDLDTSIAFVTRSGYVNLIIETARLCGGHEWALEATPLIRRFVHGEGYPQYLANLQQEKERRNGHA